MFSPESRVHLYLHGEAVDMRKPFDGLYAVENPIDTIRALRFNEVAPYIVLTQHVYSPLPFVASEALWARLSTTEREHFSRAAREAATLSRKLVKEADERNLEAMRVTGAKIIRPDVAAFRKAMSSVYARAEKVYGADVEAILKDARGDKLAAK